MTKVKICGLRSLDAIEAVNHAKANYAGCILSPGFKRSISEEMAKSFRENLQPDIPLVGVFVNEDVQRVLRLLQAGIIDIAQLHGQESEEYIAEVKAMGKLVWKVFQMKGEVDIEAIESSSADMVLLDSGTGSGESFDWSLVKQIKRPFILAGGLTPDNVTIAIEQTNPYCVDTSSGVETHGLKDKEKIAAFARAVRRKLK